MSNFMRSAAAVLGVLTLAATPPRAVAIEVVLSDPPDGSVRGCPACLAGFVPDPTGLVTNGNVMMVALPYNVSVGDVSILDAGGAVSDLLRFTGPNGNFTSGVGDRLIFYSFDDLPGVSPPGRSTNFTRTYLKIV